MSVHHILPLSTEHLAAAVLFATQARESERVGTAPLLLHPRAEGQSAALACVLLSVCYLEAEINELITNAVEFGFSQGGVLSAPEVVQRLRALWAAGASRNTLLDKYDLVLAAADRPLFDKGAKPYQPVALLIKLRNALTHFVPEKQPGGGGVQEEKELKSLSKALRHAFPENALAESYQPYFIQRALGYGSSKWAVTQSVAFVTEFRSRIGIGFSPTYLLESIHKL